MSSAGQRALWLGPRVTAGPSMRPTSPGPSVSRPGSSVSGEGLTAGVVAGGRTLRPLGLLAGAAARLVRTRSLLALVDFDPLRYWRQAATDELRGRTVVEAPVSVRVDLRWTTREGSAGRDPAVVATTLPYAGRQPSDRRSVGWSAISSSRMPRYGPTTSSAVNAGRSSTRPPEQRCWPGSAGAGPRWPGGRSSCGSRPAYPAAAWARSMDEATGTSGSPTWPAPSTTTGTRRWSRRASGRHPCPTTAGSRANRSRSCGPGSTSARRSSACGSALARLGFARCPRGRTDRRRGDPGDSPYAGLIREVRSLGEQVAAPGFDGRPADVVTMERLLHGSAAVGVPRTVHCGRHRRPSLGPRRSGRRHRSGALDIRAGADRSRSRRTGMAPPSPATWWS